VKEAGPPGGLIESVIVSTDWLEAHLEDPALRVVDIRGSVRPPGSTPRYWPKREEYEADHIPGAVFVDWTRDIVDASDPVPVQVAGAEAFAMAMTALGIGDDTLVIAYDDYDHIFASRMAWALRYHGHDAVRVLDGGFPRWKAERRPTETTVPHPARARFTSRTRSWLRRSADDVAQALSRTDALLVDARAPEQYSGAVTAARQSGHIPGARNVHYARLIDAETGQFLPTRELVRIFAEAGLDVDKLPPEIIVYCNGGISCTVPLDALRMLGRHDVAVYDGSWNEWGNDPTRPVRLGEKP
jgi:thiosulfate/3-mercaptopyruvate sulfurtransferase